MFILRSNCGIGCLMMDKFTFLNTHMCFNKTQLSPCLSFVVVQYSDYASNYFSSFICNLKSWVIFVLSKFIPLHVFVFLLMVFVGEVGLHALILLYEILKYTFNGWIVSLVQNWRSGKRISLLFIITLLPLFQWSMLLQ